MAAKRDGAAEAPMGHYIVTSSRPAGFRRGGRAWQPHTVVPAAEMTEELLAALRGDPGDAFIITGPHEDVQPTSAGA